MRTTKPLFCKKSAAKAAELQERKIIRDGKLSSESRPFHTAIKSRAAIELDVFLKKLPSSKLHDYDHYP